MSSAVPRIGAVAVVIASLAALPSPSLARQRTLLVTLPGGQQLTLHVDLPDGQPWDTLPLPALHLPGASVVEVTNEPSQPAAPQQPGAAPAKKEPAVTAKRPASVTTRKKVRGHHKAKARQHPVAPGRVRERAADPRRPSGPSAPYPTNSNFRYAIPGPALGGVPDFFIANFRIPPFLLPIYQAAALQYGVPWQVLAAINEIETDYGRNLSTSSAGAVGWMQFLPSTFETFGVDANGDGVANPYSPVDAVFSAARYLRDAGAQQDLRKAVFAYNHAGWYVDSVLMRARLIAGMPARLVGALSGLTQGRFPVAARSHYATGSRRALNIYSRAGAAVVAVQDARVLAAGRGARLGIFARIRDALGNTYTYGNLAKLGDRTRAGARVRGGSVLGRIGSATPGSPHVRFQIRPAGRHAPLVDAKPILDGWKLLAQAALYQHTTQQHQALRKRSLENRVLGDSRVSATRTARALISTGKVERRVLMSLASLAASGLKPAVTAPNHVLKISFGEGAQAYVPLKWTGLISRLGHIDNPTLRDWPKTPFGPANPAATFGIR